MTRKHEKYERLLARAKALPPVPTAVVHPCDESSLTGAVDAAKLGIIAQPSSRCGGGFSRGLEQGRCRDGRR